MPDRQIRRDEEQRREIKRGDAADERHMKHEARREQDDRRLDEADDDVRHDLAGHHLERQHRRREQVFHRAALAFARDREARHHDQRHREDHAHQARHDVVLRDRLRGCRGCGPARRMRPACRSECASGPVRSLSRDRLHELRQRGERGARSRSDRWRRLRPAATGARRAAASREIRRESFSTNCTLPCASARRPASSSGSVSTMSK